MMPGSAARSAALSAAVAAAAPAPPRAFTTLSSIGCTMLSRSTISLPPIDAVKAPRARASASVFRLASMSAGPLP